MKQFISTILLSLILSVSVFANTEIQFAQNQIKSTSVLFNFLEDDFDLGLKAFDSGDYELAIFYFTRHLSKNPKDVSAYNNRGLAYNYLKKYDLALSDFSKVLELDNQNWKAYSGRGFAYIGQQKYQSAIQEYSTAIGINPNESFLYKNRGIAYEAIGNTSSAQADFAKAEQIKSGVSNNNSSANTKSSDSSLKSTSDDYDLGIKAMEKEDYETAVQYFTKYLAQNPNDLKAYLNRGISNAVLKKYEPALRDLNIVIKADPKNVYAYKFRAIIYKNIGETSLYEADLNKIAELEGKKAPTAEPTSPTNNEDYFDLGMRAFANKNYEQSVQFFTKYINQNPNDKVAYYNRGLANDYLNNFEWAIADYNKCLELDPQYVSAYVNRGYIYARQKKYDLAIRDYSNAIKIDSNKKLAYQNRAEVYQAMGKTKAAEEDLAKVNQIGSAETETTLSKNVPMKPNSKGISWTPVVEMDNQIFPSYFLATATVPIKESTDPGVIGDSHGIIGIHVINPKKNSQIKIGFQVDSVVNYQEFEANLAEKDKRYLVFPKVVWNWDALKRAKRPSPANATFTLYINGEMIEKRTVVVQIRSINEAVFAYRFLDNNQWAFTSSLFAAYVNEDHVWIDKLLKEALDTRLVDSFSGYQSGHEGVKKQLFAIWFILQRRGIKYSSITDTSSKATMVNSQYVRLFDESISVAQANCVDGSVLIASILRKIGIDVALVTIPGHCFLAFDMNGNGDWWGFETTAIGKIDLEDYKTAEEKLNMSYKIFNLALQAGDKTFQEALPSIKAKDYRYHLVNIRLARQQGINPIDWETK